MSSFYHIIGRVKLNRFHNKINVFLYSFDVKNCFLCFFSKCKQQANRIFIDYNSFPKGPKKKTIVTKGPG